MMDEPIIVWTWLASSIWAKLLDGCLWAWEQNKGAMEFKILMASGPKKTDTPISQGGQPCPVA